MDRCCWHPVDQLHCEELVGAEAENFCRFHAAQLAEDLEQARAFLARLGLDPNAV